VGDKVTCPIPGHGGVTVIATGDPTNVFDGSAAAYHGCKTVCGATLLSSQRIAFIDTGGGDIASAAGTAAEAGDAVLPAFAAGLAASAVDEATDATAQRFRGRFRLVDQASGQPIANRRVRVRCSDGQVLDASTDADGYTPWVERDAAHILDFELLG
jgi:hypothetical protein